MIFIGIGSNLKSKDGAPPLANCERAVELMASKGADIVARSHWYESEPVPSSDQPWFVNGVVQIETTLAAAEILKMLLDLEEEMGRVRSVPNAARIIDLDLLAYGDECMTTADLVLPHPRLHKRAFVLRPLADIAPDWRHPRTGESLGELLQNIGEDQKIRRLVAAN